jgi:hypothetical protein
VPFNALHVDFGATFPPHEGGTALCQFETRTGLLGPSLGCFQLSECLALVAMEACIPYFGEPALARQSTGYTLPSLQAQGIS